MSDFIGNFIGTSITFPVTGVYSLFQQFYYRSSNNWIQQGNVSATGGTISTVGSYTYHTFTSPGSFALTSGNVVEVACIGAGGGGGGADVAVAGGGGGGGGGVVGTIVLNPGTYTVSIGGGGGGGSSAVANTGGGTAGTNGGGTGGNAGATGGSGGGGGGGGWSGISTGSIYYAVGGGGAGGGGANEGTANDIAAGGGGSPRNAYRTDSLTGVNGRNFPGDGGGHGGAGGGYDGATGGGGGPSNTQNYGGSNYISNYGLSFISYARSTSYEGSNGGAPASATAGSRAVGFSTSPTDWSPIPSTAGNGGAGDPSSPGSGSPGIDGIVVIRYLTDAYS